MSKSNSLNRSNSAETEHDLDIGGLKDPIGSSILEEGNESVTTEEDGYNADISSNNSNSNNSSNPNNNDGAGGGGGREVIPSSPPPSYEFVLEETRLKQQESVQSQSPTTPPKAPEIMHKSSKEFYKAVAKQFGITCKMSDHCRCYDCQSHYFDCEYEQNEQEKTDGGLGAGTPVFLHEVMHGSACQMNVTDVAASLTYDKQVAKARIGHNDGLPHLTFLLFVRGILISLIGIGTVLTKTHQKYPEHLYFVYYQYY